MIITLNRDEVLSLIKKQLWRLGVSINDVEGSDDVSLDTEVGFINGDLAVVVGINEEIPEGTFDNDALTDESEVDNAPEQQDSQKSDKPAKQVKRRKRRTRQEIEADEAAAKQAAETQQPQQASGEAEGESQDAKKPEAEAQKAEEVLEAKFEEAPDQTETVEATATEAGTPEPEQQAASEDDNLFAPTHTEPAVSSVNAEAEPEPTGATSNPFGGDGHDDDNLFASPSEPENKKVVETENGFAKPREDDDALNLFS